MFNDTKINRYGAQLIFTSHDLSTMNSEVFRRDEIWFVAKGNKENSKLYSLVEFKNDKGESVRKDAKFDKKVPFYGHRKKFSSISTVKLPTLWHAQRHSRTCYITI